MATYYVDTASGADGNAGTSSAAPLRSLRHALAIANSEGDGAVVQLASTAKNPIRTFRIDPTVVGGGNNLALSISAAIRLRVARGTVGPGAYVTTGVDVSEGVERGNLLINPSFEQWVDENTPMHWTKNVGTETHVREGTVVNSGTYSLKVDNGGATAFGGVEISVFLPKDCEFQFAYNAHMVTASRYVIGKIWDRSASAGSNFWHWVNQEWGADDANGQLNTTTGDVGAWAEKTGLFTTQNSGRHTIKIASSGGTATVHYQDDYSVTNVTHPNYEWQADSTAGVYYLPFLHFRPYRVFACAKSAWDSLGMEAFATDDRTNYSFRSSLANCRASEQRAYWDAANSRLYVHLPSGMAPADVHIEAIPLGAAISAEDDATVAGIGVTGTNGILIPSGATIPTQVELYGIKAIGCAASYIFNAGTIKGYGCDSVNTSWAEAGATEAVTAGDWLSLGTGTVMRIYGGVIDNGCEDGIQADAGGTYYAYGVLARNGGTDTENATETHAFKIGNNGANKGYNYYCTSVGYSGHGFRGSAAAAAGSEFTVDNCIAVDNGQVAGTDFSLPANANVTYVANENLCGTYLASGVGGSGTWESGTNNQSVDDADITSVGLNADGSIQSGSPGIDTGDGIAVGNLWTAGTPPYSAAFGPFPSRKLNKGADQR